MENLHQLPESILSLLQKKDFAQLNPKERAETEAFLGETEYAKLRETYSLVTITEKENSLHLKPRTQTQAVLLQALARKRKPNVLAGVSQYRIPAWQAAAAVLLMFLGFMLMQNRAEETVSQQLVTITDTVKVVKQEVEKILVYDTIRLAQTKPKPKKTQPGTVIIVQQPEDDQTPSAQPVPVERLSALTLENRSEFQSRGSSLSDDTLVNKFNFVTLH